MKFMLVSIKELRQKGMILDSPYISALLAC